MQITKLTSKGQTTIPKEIRNHLNIHSGDRVVFVIDDDGKVFLFSASCDVSELKGMLPKPRKAVSIEDMNKAIRKRAQGK